jgi:Na+/melibiose symporter-like transporter
MVLAGVACLLSKHWFAKSLGDLAFSYVGNLSASLAVYFIISIRATPKLRPVMIAVIALLIVQLFELTNG